MSNRYYDWAVCPVCLEGRWSRRDNKGKHFPKCRHCAPHGLKMENNPSWRGGYVYDGKGYLLIKLYPNHPFINMQNKHGYTGMHRLVMAEHLGRVLVTDEIVHHIDGDKLNNNITNLELLPRRGHRTSYRVGYERGYADGVRATTRTDS